MAQVVIQPLDVASTSRHQRIKAKGVIGPQVGDNPVLTAETKRDAACAHEVLKEKCWFEQPETHPQGIVRHRLDQSCLLQYQEVIWHNAACENLPKFGMTADEMSHLCGDASLLSPHVIWMMEQLNRMQKEAVCFYLQGHPAASLIPYLQRRGLELKSVKRLVAAISVDKHSDDTVSLSHESGSHWVLAVVDIDSKQVYYCDSLAWCPPSNLLLLLQDYCDYFNFRLTPACLVLCHRPMLPRSGQHACNDDCRNYSLQHCVSGVSGVITLVNTVVSACDWEMFSHLIGSARTTCYLKHPTEHEVYLRKVLICWFMAGRIDLRNIQMRAGPQPRPDGTSENLQSGPTPAKKPRKMPQSKTSDNESTQLGENSSDNVMIPDKKDSTGAQARKSQVVFECSVCQKALSSRGAVFKHKKAKHPETRTVVPEKSLMQCMECDTKFFVLTQLIEHYQTAHGRQFSIEKKHFACEAEFQVWKKSIEKTTNATFVKHSGQRQTIATVVGNLRCHRSGFFTSKGQGKRTLKSQGSVKINGTCPAFIKSTLHRAFQTVDVEYCLDHTHKCGVEHLTLSAESRKEIAEKLARGLSVDAVVGEIRLQSNAKGRDSIVTRRDVLNVKLTLNLNFDSSAYYAAIKNAKMEALKAVEEATSLINSSESVGILMNMGKHLQAAVKAGKGILSIHEDHNYQ